MRFHETVPFFFFSHFINWCLLLSRRYIIWKFAPAFSLFKVWCSPVIHAKVFSGQKHKLLYLQIRWTFLRRDCGCSERGRLHGQTGLGGTLGSWQPHWNRWAGSPHSCTGAGLTPAAAAVGVTLLKQKQEPFSDDLFNWGYQKSSCGGQPYLSLLLSAWFSTIMAGVRKNQHLPLCKFSYIIIFAQIYNLRSRLLPTFLYCSQRCFCTLQTFET